MQVYSVTSMTSYNTLHSLHLPNALFICYILSIVDYPEIYGHVSVQIQIPSDSLLQHIFPQRTKPCTPNLTVQQNFYKWEILLSVSN